MISQLQFAQKPGLDESLSDMQLCKTNLFSYRQVTSRINFEAPSIRSFEAAGPSHILECQSILKQSNHSAPSVEINGDIQPSFASSINSGNSLSHETEQGAFKQLKKKTHGGITHHMTGLHMNEIQ